MVPSAPFASVYGLTIHYLYYLCQQVLGVGDANLCCVLERFHTDLKRLTAPKKTLKSEGFFKTNKVTLIGLLVVDTSCLQMERIAVWGMLSVCVEYFGLLQIVLCISLIKKNNLVELKSYFASTVFLIFRIVNAFFSGSDLILQQCKSYHNCLRLLNTWSTPLNSRIHLFLVLNSQATTKFFVYSLNTSFKFTNVYSNTKDSM